MNKVELLEVKKDNTRGVFIFAKNENFMFFLNSFLDKLDLHYHETEGDNLALDIEENKEGYYNVSNNKYDVDFFVGYKEIILVVRYSMGEQQKVSDIVFEFADFEGVSE